MNITCPGCGFYASIEIFVGDVDARYFAELMGKVPPEISDLVLRYVGLFAPVKHKMTFSRGRRLLAELVPLIEARKIARNRREWPAPIGAWSEALAYMLDQRAKLTLPLKSHGYLLEVLVGMADKVEAKAEVARELQRRDGTAPAAAPTRARVEETSEQRVARMRREQEARDHQAVPPQPSKSGDDDNARRAARRAAEQEIQQRREARLDGEPRALSDVIPAVPQTRGNP